MRSWQANNPKKETLGDNQSRRHCFPLSTAKSGEIVKVVRAAGGRGLESKLAAMGIYPGVEITVVSNLGGPMIIEVKGSRLSVGHGVASKVMVEK